MDILVIDDELVSRTLLGQIISDLGNKVTIAKDGEEGWQVWNNERPSIVITDWVMPNLNGIDLCAKIRQNEGGHYTYIIIVTSKINTEDLVEAIDAGADDFLSKPYVREELAVRIRAGKRILKFQTKDIVIFSLAKIAESRDTDTGNHLERIRHYSRQIAESLPEAVNHSTQINKAFIENIYLTSPLHDIGKVGIPDSILLKPGRLDDGEFEIMKGHCRIGFNTLNEASNKYPNMDYLKMSADIALYHHEKFDGSGYPTRIAGDKIPLSARIVALADVYDALISKRVYKDAFTHDNAKSIILSGKSSHFDPGVVDAFLLSENSFKEIALKYKE